MRMLLDHKAAVGFRTIERAMTLEGNDKTLNESKIRSIILLSS